MSERYYELSMRGKFFDRGLNQLGKITQIWKDIRIAIQQIYAGAD